MDLSKSADANEEKGAKPWVDALHFCKHSDSRRQDGVLIARSLAYQVREDLLSVPSHSTPYTLTVQHTR